MIIYVEGIPASGKTTIINSLVNRFPNKIFSVPEYLDIEEGRNAETTHDQKYFIKNDEMKWQVARDSNKQFVFVDRGHLSTIVYNLVELKIHKNIEKLKILDWYFENILTRGHLPDYYVFLKTDPKLSLKRRTNILTPDNMWDYQEALEFANDYYPKFMKGYELTVPSLIIQTDLLTLDQIEENLVSHFGL